MKSNIEIAVLIEGSETGGRQLSILTQERASSDFGITFHYAALCEGSLYQKLLDSGADIQHPEPFRFAIHRT